MLGSMLLDQIRAAHADDAGSVKLIEEVHEGKKPKFILIYDDTASLMGDFLCLTRRFKS